MKIPLRFLSLISALLTCSDPLQAADVLFVGNSYTQGSGDKAVKRFGGVPRLVEEIARAKGKTVQTAAVTKGGKSWSYHLEQPVTNETIASKPWKCVVLQDYSRAYTTEGLEKHVANAEGFYQKIRTASPEAIVVLYETWPRGPKNPMTQGQEGVEKMAASIHDLYQASDAKLEGLDEGEQVRTAPVGDAFVECLRKHPEINLYSADNHHASALGSYLAALVIYATIFEDSPKGAIHAIGDVQIDPATAQTLQNVAADVVSRSAVL